MGIDEGAARPEPGTLLVTLVPPGRRIDLSRRP